MEWTTQPFSGTSHPNKCHPFTFGRLNSDAVMAPNILGLPVLELLPEAVFEHDKKSPETYIKKKTKKNNFFFFLNTVLFPTLSYKLFPRLNSEYLLTISESQICSICLSAVNCSGLCHHWDYSKEYTRGSKSYFMGQVKQNQTLWAVAPWLEVGGKVSSPVGTIGGELDASITLAG